MPVTRRFRTTPTKHDRTHFSFAESGIDRQNSRLLNVIGMETGVALGHNVYADIRTLEIAADLANSRNVKASEFASNRGGRTGNEVAKTIRQRFGHPSISADGTGRTIGTLSDFRVEGGKLLHNTQFYDAARLSPAFQGDVIEYIFRLAEEAPESLNESAVVDANLVWTFEDGTEQELSDDDYERAEWGQAKPPEGALTELPVLRPFSMSHIDLVSDGALTNTLFSNGVEAERFFSAAFDGHSSAYGSELFTLIDRFRDQFGLTLTEIETKGIEIITRYVYARREHPHKDLEGAKIMKRNKNRPNVSRMAYEGDDGAVQTADEIADVAIVQETETAVQDIDPVEPVAEVEERSDYIDETADDEETDVDDTLDEVGDILAEAEAEAEEEEAETETAQGAVLSQLQDRVRELSVVVEAQSIQIEKATKLLLQQARQLQAIGRNLRRIDGERVVSQNVPLTPAANQVDQLEPMVEQGQDTFVPPLHGYQNPQGKMVSVRQFSNVIDGDPNDLVLASDSPAAVAEKAASNRVARNRQYRMGTRK